jgi:transposase
VKQPIDCSANQDIVQDAGQLAPAWHEGQAQQRVDLPDLPGRETPIQLTDRLRRVARILEIVRIEEHVVVPKKGGRGRAPLDRRPLARAFLAKAILNLPQTRQLIEQLHQSPALREVCGVEAVPSEATFSRAFAQFARLGLGDLAQSTLVEKFISGQLVLHVSHDTTAVEAREKPARKRKRIKEKKTGPTSEGRGEAAQRADASAAAGGNGAFAGTCRTSSGL